MDSLAWGELNSITTSGMQFLAVATFCKALSVKQFFFKKGISFLLYTY
jgi:hypothetical protein